MLTINSKWYNVIFVFISVCGKTRLNGTKGTIKSPKFPRRYPYNERCNWIIEGPVGYQIVLKFLYFEMESASQCRFDYLLIKDGLGETSTIIGRYCGSSKPATIITSQNTALLRFNSDSSIARGGFLIGWNAIYQVLTKPSKKPPINATEIGKPL